MPHRDKEKARAAVRKHGRALHGRAVQKLGGKCANPDCRWANLDGSFGCQDPRCLQIDHKYGDGADDRRKFKHILNFYRSILRDEDLDRYQVLCANCNWIKRHVNKEHLRRIEPQLLASAA